MNTNRFRGVMPRSRILHVAVPMLLCALFSAQPALAGETASPTSTPSSTATAAPSPTMTPVVLVPTDSYDPAGRPSVKADFKGRSGKLDVVLDYRRIDGPPLEFGVAIDDESLTLEETDIAPGERASFTVSVPYESCATLTLQAEGEEPEEESLGCNDRQSPGQSDQFDQPDEADATADPEVPSLAPTTEPQPTTEPTKPQEEITQPTPVSTPTPTSPEEEPVAPTDDAKPDDRPVPHPVVTHHYEGAPIAPRTTERSTTYPSTSPSPSVKPGEVTRFRLFPAEVDERASRLSVFLNVVLPILIAAAIIVVATIWLVRYWRNRPRHDEHDEM